MQLAPLRVGRSDLVNILRAVLPVVQKEKSITERDNYSTRKVGAVQVEMQPTHNSKAPSYNPWKLYKVMSWFLKPLLSNATCAATAR
jgi:hypothetical protein